LILDWLQLTTQTGQSLHRFQPSGALTLRKIARIEDLPWSSGERRLRVF